MKMQKTFRMRSSQLVWYPRRGQNHIVGLARLGPEFPGEWIEVQVYGPPMPGFDTPVYARDVTRFVDTRH